MIERALVRVLRSVFPVLVFVMGFWLRSQVRSAGRSAQQQQQRQVAAAAVQRQAHPQKGIHIVWVLVVPAFVVFLYAGGPSWLFAGPTKPIAFQARPWSLPTFKQEQPQAAPAAPGATEGATAGRAAVQRQAGDYDVRGAPSISAAKIDAILASYGSPAASTGPIWYDLGKQYQIDPAYAIAFFIHESSAGTNQAWAGLKGGGETTHNVGNIICAGYPSCYGRFRDYPSWQAGIEDWYRLISVEYIQGRGAVTVDQIVRIYAPSSENDTEGYISTIENQVDTWRTGQ